MKIGASSIRAKEIEVVAFSVKEKNIETKRPTLFSTNQTADILYVSDNIKYFDTVRSV